MLNGCDMALFATQSLVQCQWLVPAWSLTNSGWCCRLTTVGTISSLLLSFDKQDFNVWRQNHGLVIVMIAYLEAEADWQAVLRTGNAQCAEKIERIIIIAVYVIHNNNNNNNNIRRCCKQITQVDCAILKRCRVVALDYRGKCRNKKSR